MKKISLIKGFLLLLIIFASVIPMAAQTGFEDDVDDEPVDEEPQAPIDGVLWAGIAGGGVLGYFLLRKQDRFRLS